MSGGSYNYLCWADAGSINEKMRELAQMQDRLIELGYTDAAKETEGLILILSQTEVRIDARISRLSSVWRSVEWLDSGDGGEDAVAEAISQYRGDLTTPQGE